MKAHSIADQNIALLKKVLDLRAENEKVIASNIANSETPGYAPKRFSFENDLKQAVARGGFGLKTTNPGHISTSAGSIDAIKGTITREEDKSGIGDQNGVSLAEEMMALSKNELLYETAAQLLSKKLTLQKYIIQGGQ